MGAVKFVYKYSIHTLPIMIIQKDTMLWDVHVEYLIKSLMINNLLCFP